jgi:predicted ATP-grasp superfamily ATP-dependent carboligase
MSNSVLILGASTRAAAFSALRAGLQPHCADLFADVDLQTRCPVTRIPPSEYPTSFRDFLRSQADAPWIYTGGLENRPRLVDELARMRPLWGNDAATLRRARSPVFVAKVLREAGLPSPAVRSIDEGPPRSGRWLVKPRDGVGGGGIHFLGDVPPRPIRRAFWQEYIEGEACAAVYVAAEGRATLLGVTRQLVGEPWLHAAPFHYCGSIARTPAPRLRDALERLGNVLAAGCGLRGIFGIDFILQGETPWPVEINPRYTASVEVVEHAQGIAALALHRQAFDPSITVAGACRQECLPHVGKAILFASTSVRFPREGPWLASLLPQPSPQEPPAFADIPAADEVIQAGRPICTLFAVADSEAACHRLLQQKAAGLDDILKNGPPR